MFCSFFNIFVFVCIKFHFIKNHHVGLTFDFTCTLQSMNSVSFFFVCVSFVSVLEEQNKNEINLNYALFGLDVVFFQPVIIFSRKKLYCFHLILAIVECGSFDCRIIVQSIFSLRIGENEMKKKK